MRFKLIEELEMSGEYDNEGNQLTVAQAEFFKNSKVRDSQGRLLVCYHGTDAEFDTFKKEFIGSKSGLSMAGKGFYFTSDIETSSHYGSPKKFYLNLTNPYIFYMKNYIVGKTKLSKNVGENGRVIIYDDLTADFIVTRSNQIKSIDNKNPSSSNNINESVSTKEQVLQDLDKLFGQENVYMWSTYILPNGHFLNPDNKNAEEYWEEIDQEPDYEHSDFMYFRDNKWGDGLFNDCIKMNVTYPYLILPRNKPTQEQLRAIEKIIENKSEFAYDISGIEDWVAKDLPDYTKEPLIIDAPFGNKVFELSLYTAKDIIKEINKGYTVRSFLDEELYEPYKYKKYKINDNFFKWFDGSVVTTLYGDPLVVYHGTRFSFNKFIPNESTEDFPPAIYFTSNLNIAKSYGSNVGKYFIKLTNPFYDDAEGRTFNDYYDDFVRVVWNAYNNKNDGVIVRRLRDDAMQNGSKSVGTTYVVFDSYNIKSVENNGEWNDDSDNIYESFVEEDEYDKVLQSEIDKMNKWLNRFGLRAEIIEDEDIDFGDDVGLFLQSMQNDAKVFPIALNKKAILEYSKDDSSELYYAIKGTIWHEIGHGIFTFLNDIYNLDDLDEEEIVEEFAREIEDSELYDILWDYINKR